MLWFDGKNMSSGGISENSQKIGFFCSMGKKENVKVVIFKNIQIYKNCHFPNLIFSRCTPLLLILMWYHFGINIIELVFLQMLHPLGANCAPLLLPCYHMTHRSCCCCYIEYSPIWVSYLGTLKSQNNEQVCQQIMSCAF